MLDPAVIRRYNAFRRSTDKSRVCHAPFVSLNFEQNGNITACCYNRSDVLGRYPENSILDAWTGEAAEALRGHIRNNELEGGCSICNELLQAGNFAGTKALYYDEYAPPHRLPEFIRKRFASAKPELPRVVELELSNTCNLECEMCTGYFSSTIRKNRDQLPPLPMVYDSAFTEQLAQLMPGLTDIKFLGGEPFLIDRYYEIWEAIVRVNPAIRVHITTNGTVWNNRVQNLLRKLKAGIVVSLDSLDPQTYARIRAGATLDKTLANIVQFRELTRSKKTYLSIAVCPMVHNWREMPALLQYANGLQADLHFNVVWSPEELSIQSLSAEALQQVVSYLEAHQPKAGGLDMKERKNAKAYADLLATIRFWLQGKQALPDSRDQAEQQLQRWLSGEAVAVWPELSETQKKLLAGILWFDFGLALPLAIEAGSLTTGLQQHRHWKDWITQVKRETEARVFGSEFIGVLRLLNEHLYGKPDAALSEKFDLTETIIRQTDKPVQLAQEMTETPPLRQLENIRNFDKDKLTGLMRARYA